MKLSNKALTFLLAQNRAILMRSVMVSLGSVLVVGSCSTATAAVVSDLNAIKKGGTTLEIDGNNSSLQISTGYLPQIAGTLHITGGAADKTGNYILNNANSVNIGLGGGGSVIIDTKSAGDGLYLSQSDNMNGGKFELSTYTTEVRSGTLHLKGNKGATVLSSQNIVISGSDGVEGRVLLEGKKGAQASMGNSAGYAPSVIHLQSGGVIELKGDGDITSAYVFNKISGEGGTIKVTDMGTIATYGRNNNLNLEVKGVAAIYLDDVRDAPERFILEINSGTISLEDASSALHLLRGNVILGDNVRLEQRGGDATATTGIQFTVDDRDKVSFLQLNSKTLQSYLNGTDTGHKGLVKLSQNSNIVLTDNELVDLNSLGLKFSSTGTAGTLMLAQKPVDRMIIGATVTGKKIKVDRKFAGAENFQIVADELDLTQASPLTDGDYGFRSLGASKSIVLDKVTKSDLYLGLYLDPNAQGIMNNLSDDITILGKGLTAYRGVWEQDFNLTLGDNSGTTYTTLSAGGQYDNQQDNYSFKRAGTYILGDGKSIKLYNGKLLAAQGTMDLTKGTIDISDAGSSSKIAAADKGVLKINAADFNEALSSSNVGFVVGGSSQLEVKNVDPTSGVSFDLGKIETQSDVFNLIFDDQSIADKIYFDTRWKGKLSFDGTLNLQGSTIDVSTLTLGAHVLKADDADPLSIKNGVVEVSQGLEAAKGVILGAGGSGVLRLVDSAEGALQSNGAEGVLKSSVETADSSLAGTALEVQGGKWLSKGDVTLKGQGLLNIGSDENVDTIFTMEGKLATVGADAVISVNHGKAQLKANTVSLAQDSSLKISDGSVVLNGDSGVAGSVAGTVAGINISGAKVDLKGKGSLIFGQNVVLAGFNVADNKVEVADGLKAVFTGDEASSIKFDGAIAGVGASGLSLAQIDAIMNELDVGANSAFQGLVHFGDNNFDVDIGVDQDGNKYISAADFAIFGKVVNEKATNSVLEETRVTELKVGQQTDQMVQGSIGALQGEDAIASGQIYMTGTTKLNHAVNITLADGTKLKAYVFAKDEQGSVDGSLNGTGGTGSVDGSGGSGNVDGTGSNKVEFAHLLGLSNGDTGKNLTLANGGYVADISMKNGSLHIDQGETVVEGNVAFTEKGDLVVHQDSALLVNGNTSLDSGSIVSHARSSLKVSADLSLKSDASLLGKVEIGGNLSMPGKSNLKVLGGDVETQKFEVKVDPADTKGMTIRIGQESSVSRGDSGAQDNLNTLHDETKSYGGSLFAQNMELNKSLVVVDPDYGEQAAFFGAHNLNSDNHLNATLIVAQNSIAAVGFNSREDALATAYQLQDEQGSLNKDKYGALLVLNKGVVLDGDSTNSTDSLTLTAGSVSDFVKRFNSGSFGMLVEGNNERDALKNKVYLGANTAIVVSDEAEQAAKRKAQGANAIAVTNGAVRVTPPRSEALISFKNASGTIIADGGHVVMASETSVGDQVQVFDNAQIKYLSGGLYDPTTGDPNYNIKLTNLSGFLSGVVNATGFAVIGLDANARSIAGEASDPLFDTYVAYVNRSDKSKSNSALVKIIDSYGAADGDRILRAPAFAGVAHASFAASLPIEQALKARFDVGTSTLDLRSSDGEALFSSGNINVKGGSLFVAPIYSSFETDPLGAQGLAYAVDLDLYGTVVGLDYELMPNLRVGGLVSLGKGEVKGSHAASKLSNDFKYYGVGAFASLKLDDFTLVSDVSHTKLSHDVKTGVSALAQDSLSLDSSHVVIGSSLQYRGYSFNDVDVMPYLGVHYHNIAIDNYSVASMGSSNNENISYLAVPVGVTVAKNFTVGDWKLKHSVDLNVTSNLGLDDINSSFKWENFEEYETQVSSKFLDKYSAGATLGLEAQMGNFECNVGFNYQVSKDSKSVGLNAGMRYLF